MKSSDCFHCNHDSKVCEKTGDCIRENQDGFTDDLLNMGYTKGYSKGRADAIEFFKKLIIRNDEDYDIPTISMKFLNDYIEQMIVDGFGELKEQKQ